MDSFKKSKPTFCKERIEKAIEDVQLAMGFCEDIISDFDVTTDSLKERGRAIGIKNELAHIQNSLSDCKREMELVEEKIYSA